MKPFRILVAMAALALGGSASGQTLAILHSFAGVSDGAYPAAALVQATDGNFYGTAQRGETYSDGTVFRIAANGSFTNLYSFNGNDGSYPQSALVQGNDGNLYGTTSQGGAGYGFVFRITPSGVLTNLHAFFNYPPSGGVVQGSDGYFYGEWGGCVYQISSSGSFTNLYCPAGYAVGGLVQGRDGYFYGTTENGGASDDGTVFRFSPSGSSSNLYTFTGSDGAYPSSALVQGSDGNLYGTTSGGGAYGSGTVFRISTGGDLTNLYSFTGGADGAIPESPLVLGSDGNFYGTTYSGGTHATGTVFQMSPGGGLTNLYSFTGGTDGANPRAGLIQGSDGSFYGTADHGGAHKYGTIFKFSVPLNPPANQIGGFQPVGSNLVFTVPSVAGETYQLQFATDLVSGNWSNVPGVSVTNSIGAGLTVTNFGAATGPQGFYRFAITP